MRIALLCSDLLFGTKVQGGMRAAGHEVELHADEAAGRAAADAADVVVVDLNDEAFDAPAVVESLAGVPVLGFYAHTDQETRRRAEAAGASRVVPRSRMAREMGSLLEGLVPAR